MVCLNSFDIRDQTCQLFLKPYLFLWTINGVALVCSIGLTLPNVFMCCFKDIWLENCPPCLKPVIYRRFVDVNFLFSESNCHVKKSRYFLIKDYKNIKFTLQIEKNVLVSLLDIKISLENNKFMILVYRRFYKL